MLSTKVPRPKPGYGEGHLPAAKVVHEGAPAGINGLAGVPSIFEYSSQTDDRPAAGRSLRHLTTETLDGGLVWLHYRVEESPSS